VSSIAKDWTTEALPKWKEASRAFAEAAEGEVHVFHNAATVRLESIWREVEYPVLRTNSKVTKIIYHILMEDGTEVVVP
jgi:hypothetical protein